MRDTVFFSADTCRITLHLPKLIELPVPNLRKLFKLMLLEPWNNEEAIQTTELFIPDAVTSSKAKLQTASDAYAQGWRKVQNPRSRHPDVRKVLKENRRLTEDLKAAKALHDSWVKIQAIWLEAANG